MKLKTGDKVVVIAGKDKGKEGLITKTLSKDNKVIVEGVNIPFDWKKDFSPDHLEQIRFICLVMSRDYITGHFSNIKITFFTILLLKIYSYYVILAKGRVPTPKWMLPNGFLSLRTPPILVQTG